MDDTENDPVQSLSCMHVFHIYCLGELCKMTPSMGFKCPQCKTTQGHALAFQIESDAARLVDTNAAASSLQNLDEEPFGPLSADDIEDELRSQFPLIDHNSNVDSKGGGKGASSDGEQEAASAGDGKGGGKGDNNDDGEPQTAGADDGKGGGKGDRSDDREQQAAGADDGKGCGKGDAADEAQQATDDESSKGKEKAKGGKRRATGKGKAKGKGKGKKAQPKAKGKGKGTKGKAHADEANGLGKGQGKAHDDEAKGLEKGKGKAHEAKGMGKGSGEEQDNDEPPSNALALLGSSTLGVAPSTADRSMFPCTSIFCYECGRTVDKDNCRIRNKGCERFRCKSCQSKITQIHRGLGEWPTKQFVGMALESRQAFMRQLDGMEGKKIVDKTKIYMDNFHTEEKKYAFGGVFWPLNKWRHEGFEEQIEKIEHESDPNDVTFHKILGKTYRVPMMSKSQEGTQGTSCGDRSEANVNADQVMQMMQKMMGPQPSGSTVKALENTKEAEESIDSDESSSSSSSSSNKKKKKKKLKKKTKQNKKKEKKEKKQKLKEKERLKEAEAEDKKRKAEEKVTEREAKKASSKNVKVLQMQLTRTEKTWASMEAQRANPKFFSSLMEAVQREANVIVEKIVEDKVTLKGAIDRGEAIATEPFQRRCDDAQRMSIMLSIMLRNV
jgi:hypothetical protein